MDSESAEQRKLAAIMFTDMVGYSALAQRDDKLALELLEERRIELKIGILIGDVVHREGDVYGDGVNIASRIEALAGAGGICVSMDVERQIRNALEARFEKFGSADLKNIKLPMDLFRIVLPWEKSADLSAKGPSKKSPVLIPAVAVLIILALLAGWWWMERSGKNQQPVATHAAPTAP